MHSVSNALDHSPDCNLILILEHGSNPKLDISLTAGSSLGNSCPIGYMYRMVLGTRLAQPTEVERSLRHLKRRKRAF